MTELTSIAAGLLTAPQAAKYLGLAVSTLAKIRCKSSALPYHKLGRRIAYSRADLDAWLASRRVRNTVESDKLPRRLTDETRAA